MRVETFPVQLLLHQIGFPLVLNVHHAYKELTDSGLEVMALHSVFEEGVEHLLGLILLPLHKYGGENRKVEPDIVQLPTSRGMCLSFLECSCLHQ